ncbi:MAG: SH3 domain-containing protein, partial [Chloroflexi bacterium]|nr:SH3 domain-containing protein [Chloroflexota bacterium]
MKRQLLVLAFALVGFFSWASLTMGQAATSGWHATYWNNTDLDGTPVLQLFETDQNNNPELDRNWGTYRPWPQVETDYFSARWERTLFMAPGRYRFSATADDGVRVWVNDQLIIDEWFNQVVSTHLGYYDVTQAGDVNIRIEYYEFQHEAVAKLTWDHIFGSDTAVTNQLYQPTITGWRGEYFNNRIVAGTPALVRDDTAIDFDWGIDSPAIQSINAEAFSVRWTRTLNLPAGIYRFTTTTDDGVRLYVNDVLVIDQWGNQTSFTSHASDVNHSGGALRVKMEYFDDVGLAQAKLVWEKIGEATATGLAAPRGFWRGEYYDNRILAAQPALVRYDNEIDFDWGTDSPVPQYLIRDGFSVRWTGTLDLPAGEYEFTTSTDDGVRLWVNDQLIIDKWRKQAELAFSFQLTLSGGSVPVKMEYFNEEDKARAFLTWDRLDGPLPENRGMVVQTAVSPSSSISGSPSAPPITLPAINIPPDTPTSTISVNTLNVRAEPSMLSDKIGEVKRGDTIAILGRNEFNNWLQAALPDNRLGWVHVLYVELDFPIAELEVVHNPTTAVPLTADENITVTATINSSLNQIRT